MLFAEIVLSLKTHSTFVHFVRQAEKNVTVIMEQQINSSLAISIIITLTI